MKSGRYIVNRVTKGTTGPQTESLWQDEEKAPMCRGRRCLVLMTVCLGLICVLLLVFITLQHIHCSTITAERDLLKSYKNTVEEFNHTISLQDNNTDLMTEKDQLKNNFNSLSQKELELETRIKYPTAEEGQSQNSSHSLSQELETRDKDLFAEKSQLETRVKDLTTEKSQLETRANDCTAEKSHLETRVNDLNAEKGQLQKSFDSLSQKKLELETRVKDLTAEKDQLNQTKLELESNVTSLSEELKKEKSKQGQYESVFNSFSSFSLFLSIEFLKWEFLLGNPRGPVCLFKSNESSWSESRQFCRDHGGDLVIINTEEKQKHITSFIKERVWIGLSKTENKGTMKWVDNSTLEKGFWFEDEPKNAGRNEDCVELMPLDSTQNWNDLPCSEKRKGICEK
ncbi:unnamed protein product [Leuciscus chuanchicus]